MEFDTKNVLTLRNMRAFARRQRMFMMAYMTLSDVKTEENSSKQSNDNSAAEEDTTKTSDVPLLFMSCELIERVTKMMRKQYKTHRSTVDQDAKWLRGFSKECITYLDDEVRRIKKEVA